MATKKPQSPAMEFLVDSLKKNPKAAYADIKARADEKKLKLFPVMFGRAQLMLGIVKAAKRGTGKFAKASAAKAAKASASKASAATKGKRGRPVDGSSKSGQVRSLLASGMSVAEIAKKVGCTPALVYNVKSTSGGAKVNRGPGRPPKAKNSAVASMDGLAGILDAVKNSERQRVAMRAALEKIQAVIADALVS